MASHHKTLSEQELCFVNKSRLQTCAKHVRVKQERVDKEMKVTLPRKENLLVEFLKFTVHLNIKFLQRKSITYVLRCKRTTRSAQ